METRPLVSGHAADTAAAVEEDPSAYLLPAGALGLVAAVLAAVVWGLIVRWTHHEVGIAATGVGLAVGAAVDRASGGTRGTQLQVLAVALALAGVLLGKYLAFVWIMREVIDLVGLPIHFSVLSSSSVHAFWTVRHSLWDGYDLLWAALASLAAWHVTSPSRSS